MRPAGCSPDYSMILARSSPEEVLLAEELPVLDEALLAELVPAVGALEALGVPVLVQDLQDEPVQDEEAAASALRDAVYKTKQKESCASCPRKQMILAAYC